MENFIEDYNDEEMNIIDTITLTSIDNIPLTDHNEDRNFIQQLGNELQKRIGHLPKVELMTIIFNNQINKMLCVKPKSYTEISRTIRAARTMKLIVRGCGHFTSTNYIFYNTNNILLIDCNELSDSKRIEFINIKCKITNKIIEGIKILSCVSINELINYQINHNIEINQVIETYSILGTIIGSIVCTQPGIIGLGSNASGGCLTDEVIAIRIVNCHGDLIEYTNEDEINAAISNLGLLGIVYDVTLKYSSITLTKVNYQFHKWYDLLSVENVILKDAITINQSVELIYLPYNSCRIISNEFNDTDLNQTNLVDNDDVDNNDGCIDLETWNIQQDEVLLRTTKRMSHDTQDGHITSVMSNDIVDMENNSNNNNDNNNDPLINYDSDPQQLVYLLDQVFGPFSEEFIEQPENTPKLLKRAHHYLKCKYCPQPTVIQYTPWALNSFGKFKEPLRILKFTMETDYELNHFRMAMNTILDVLHRLATDKSSCDSNNYSINLGLRVQFTRGTRNGYLLGVGLECNQHTLNRRQLLLAHITFMGLTGSGSNKLWNHAAKQIMLTMLTKIPSCMPHWKTEWHAKQIVFNKFREALKEQAEPLKKLIAVADRDGMFLNESLASIFYSKLTFYQKLYQSQRNAYLATI
ncbi:LIM domain-binding protein 1 [Schistosoma japonicum]|nr:LIM domain-binding protein 1 [Schistosoma japonicum]